MTIDVPAELHAEAKPEKITAADIRLALRTRYPNGSHALFYEVSDGVGHTAGRRIDAIGVGIWPSTGQEVHGIEIKVSRSDWKREIANPKKAQDLMRFCNRWYLACPAGVVSADEVPETWGLLTVNGGGIREQRKAPRLTPEPLTRHFICSLLREAGNVDAAVINTAVNKARVAAEGEFKARLEREVAADRTRRERRIEESVKKVERIEKMVGTPLDNWLFDDEEFARAIQMVRRSGLAKTHNNLSHIFQTLKHQVAAIRAALDEAGLAVPGEATEGEP